MRDLPSADYRLFARELCFRRLEEAGFVSALHDEKTKAEFLEKAFEVITAGSFNEIETRFVVDKWRSSERPYIEKLRQKLFDGMRLGKTPGVASSNDIESVLDKLYVSNYPLLEKMNIYLFYRGWRSAASLQVLAEHIAGEARALLNTGEAGKYSRQLEKRKGDMLAQMYRECGGKQQYLGIDTFIDMSQGLPRNLLVVLKSIYNWSTFRGEGPFVKGQISATSQREGVREAAEWFFDDARSPGDDGSAIRASIRRLATLFREIRYSDKPSEKALCTFSADMPRASEEAQRIVSLAEKWSLLLRVTEGQKDKNTFRIDEKFFINPMLAPKWDLPTARGGALALQPNEVNAIFDESHSELFEALQNSRVSAMTAPLFGLKPTDASVEDHGQTNLEWDSADD